jgi:hypothetical protein
MSLNNLQLSDYLLTELYPHTLLQTEGTIAVPGNNKGNLPDTELKHLGDHKQSTAILVNKSDTAFLSDEEFSFLTNVLTACKLGLADVAIINTHNAQASAVQQKLEKLDSRNVLMMGLTPEELDLPIHFPPFQLQKFNSRTFLHAPSLSALSKDKALKAKLWMSLKTLFGI